MIETIIFLGSVLVLYFLKSFIQQTSLHIIMLLGGKQTFWLGLYTLIFLPGIVIHEVAHFLTASLLGVRSGAIEILPDLSTVKEGRIALGSVKIEKTDPIRGTIVGMAPLIFGTACLYFIVQYALHLTSPLMLGAIPFSLRNILFLYLAIAIANSMFLSKEDLQTLPIFTLLLLVVGVSIRYFNLSRYFEFVFALSYQIPRLLMTTFVVVTALHVVLALMFALTELVISRVTRKRIRYGK